VAEQPCRTVEQGRRIELQSPFFVFCLDTTDGLRARSWTNRLTGRSISLGGGPEVQFDIGLPGGRLQTPQLTVTKVAINAQGQAAEVAVELDAAEPPATVTVTYRWNAQQPVLRKFVTILNRGTGAWNRLLNVRLGTYKTQAKPSGAEWQGFPVYLDGQFFLTLAHPAGWAERHNEQVELRQHPGVKLAAGQRLQCMETVLGVAKSSRAQEGFIAHVQGRMRRVLRGHDGPYTIFEPFGARPNGNFEETEEFLLDNLDKLAEGQRQSGCHFDFYSLDFWVDVHGDLKRCDPTRFPHGLTPITERLKKLGTPLGLWIDSGGLGGGAWSIGGNPAVKSCFSDDVAKGGLCRASEPIKSMYTEAFRHHIRQNGVRLFKFDNLLTECNNPRHEHLPGVYSTEAIDNALIEFLHALDAECPDVLLMLYWGYRSPWWLLHADTLFDSGIGIEAASPSDQPAPYARDSITQKLDQAQWTANQNVPPLGKDSLGVWLSNWGWNSQVGKERWESGVVMDLCRGSLLLQPWSDTPWLSPPERRQMTQFITLLKARPDCFRNSRLVVGDPRRNDEPYGYCCSGGKRAFLALNNCCWNDRLVRLELNSSWGLSDGQNWDLYRWYPEPAQLTGATAGFRGTASIALRPFEIVLLEAVLHGQAPTLNRLFRSMPIPAAFAQPSRPVDLVVDELRKEEKRSDDAIWTMLEPAQFASSGGATLRKLTDGSILAGGKNPSPDTYTIIAPAGSHMITGFRLEALTDPSLPAQGPGRAPNGNFALDEFRVTAWPRNNPGQAVAVKLRRPNADFSQRTFGHWMVAMALDGDPKTGWSVDPWEGRSHTAVFETETPVGFPEGTMLRFEIQQGFPRDHNLGHWRLSVTGARPPLPSPAPIGPRRLIIKGRVPASAAGGVLVISTEIERGGQPIRVQGPANFLTAEARLGGKTAICQPVMGTATYPSCWQAWRIGIEPSAQPQPLGLTITASFGPEFRLNTKGHFLPNAGRARNSRD